MKNSIIVSDTSPLIYLMKIRSLSLLGRLYSRVYIPQEVFKELTRNPKFPDENELIKKSKYIQVVEVQNEDSVQKLIASEDIHRGEAEAIILAKELNIKTILMEDNDGRKAAKNELNEERKVEGKELLNIQRTIEILSEAYKQEIIDEDDIERISLIARQNKHLLPEGFSEDIRNIPNEYVKGREF